MKLILPLFALLPFVATAQPLSAFSFATLAWGESVATVDTKLKSEGFSGCEALVMLRLKCKANEYCECFFKGPGILDGRAQFREGQLGLVVVTATSTTAALDALKRKYGPHLPVAPSNRPMQSLLEPDPSTLRRWKSGDEALTFVTTTGVLIYESPATTRRNREIDTPNTSKF